MVYMKTAGTARSGQTGSRRYSSGQSTAASRCIFPSFGGDATPHHSNPLGMRVNDDEPILLTKVTTKCVAKAHEPL